MKKHIKNQGFRHLATYLGIIVLMGACSSTQSIKRPLQTFDPVEKLHRDIENVLSDSLMTQSTAGIKIVSLDTDEILYAKNSQRLFHPASNMKLLTTATALKTLGPDYIFPTGLYTDSAAFSEGNIKGNLYIKGYGNPDLTTDDLEQILMELKNKKITRISGDLIFDDFYFDSLYWGAGWMWDDASAWEYAPIHALSVNDNCVKVTVEPGDKVGDSLVVRMNPETSYLTIDNKGVTVDSTDTLKINRFKAERDWINRSNVVLIRGGLAIHSDSEEYEIDVIDGALYTATLFAKLLVKNGIIFNGKIYRQRVPQNAQMVVKYPSEPLSLVIYNTNKISDNLSAEMLLKTIGAESKGMPGSAKKGISVIYAYLQSVGVDSFSYYLADGSGVSRYNVITPNLMIQLLKDMDRDFAVQAEFAASLPIAGADGTLEHRMITGPAALKLRAKTGTLRGVSALSGYTTTADGEKLAFSIMIEHFVTRSSNIRKIQDRIGQLMSGFTRKAIPPVNEKADFEFNQKNTSSIQQ